MFYPAMTGPDHAQEARGLLANTERPDRYGELGREIVRQQLAEAQVHATLALLAAVVQSGSLPPVWHNLIREWEQDEGDPQ